MSTSSIYAVRYAVGGTEPAFVTNANHWNNPRLGMGTLRAARSIVSSRVGTIKEGFRYKDRTSPQHVVDNYSIMELSPDGTHAVHKPLNAKRMKEWFQHKVTIK